ICWLPRQRWPPGPLTSPVGWKASPATKTPNCCRRCLPYSGPSLNHHTKGTQMSEFTDTPETLNGRFGPFGGQYAPETLIAPLQELEKAWLAAQQDPDFQARLQDLMTHYVGRPTALYEAT